MHTRLSCFCSLRISCHIFCSFYSSHFPPLFTEFVKSCPLEVARGLFLMLGVSLMSEGKRKAKEEENDIDGKEDID